MKGISVLVQSGEHLRPLSALYHVRKWWEGSNLHPEEGSQQSSTILVP